MKRNINYRCIAIDDKDGFTMYYSFIDEKWHRGIDIVDDSDCTVEYPCKTRRAFYSHIRKHDEIPKGSICYLYSNKAYDKALKIIK